MKNAKEFLKPMICTVVVFCALILGIVLFLSKASAGARQYYFEGKVSENSDEYIVVEIDSSYEKLINELGKTVEIEKKVIVSERDYSKFVSGEGVRVIYSGIDSKKHELEHVFAIYDLSEIR